MSSLARAAPLLVLAGSAYGKVCDTASQKHVPCNDLKGGTSIPQVAMGSWSGSYKDCESSNFTCVENNARSAIDTWMKIGGTHIDTANDYRTQTSIAEALRGSGKSRDELFITTKCPGAMGYEATMQCADDNLQMLGHYGSDGIGYIDLLLVHFPFTMKPSCRFSRDFPECKSPNKPYLPASTEQLQDTWRAMEELKKIGVVKAIGLSDYNVTNLQDTVSVVKSSIDVHQVEWNPLFHDEEMLKFCKDHGIQLQAWSPLGGSRGSVLSHPTIVKIAKAHNRSTAQVTLRWSLQRGVIVVVGTSNPAHEQGDIELFDFELTDADVEEINGIQNSTKALII